MDTGGNERFDAIVANRGRHGFSKTQPSSTAAERPGGVDPEQPALFEADTVETRSEPSTPGQRRRARQDQCIANGAHPLTAALPMYRLRPLALHPDQSRTCGTCRFRRSISTGARAYPKCTWTSPERLEQAHHTHGPGTDLKASWPGCIHHQQTDKRKDQS